MAASLLTWLIFATSFVVRPVGAALFGHLGDKIGRKTTFITTLLLMGAATSLMGLLPTYAEIGLAAPPS
jgi:MFS family permease